MGNEVSQEEEEFYNTEYEEPLESPNVDNVVNAGTTAANCQPKHTRREEAAAAAEAAVVVAEQGQEVGLAPDRQVLMSNTSQSTEDERAADARYRRSGSSNSGEQQRRRGAAQDPKKMSYIQMARMGYQELVNAIIRPPRADYKEETLGPPAFSFCGKRFTRTDFTLMTKRGLNLQCSHWEPVERTSDRIPVVIYMHGNSSARVEVLPQLSYLLSLGLAVFSFDFAGSGKSDGEYVSLGYYEREDLMCVIAHLRATNVVSTIALWGRSMGAATALMHGDRDPSIACMILDSPFADLTQLCEEMVEKGKEQGIHVPGMIVSVAIRMLQSSIKKQANFNLRLISPIAHADKCFIPALFVAGEHDDFIQKHHSEQIYARYAGDKNLIIVEGDHNSPRPKFMFDSVSIFLQTCLQIPNSWALPVHPGMNLMAPPWYYPTTYPQPRTIKSPRKQPQQQQQQGASSGEAGFNSTEMGMTQERQREIQASLFKMLGQADDVKRDDNESSSSKPAPRTNGSSNGSAHSTSANSGSGGDKSETVEVGVPFNGNPK
mmetsp:Transcript_12602/g.21013  ORF Transcript_12602/g.21013 Transcript_12602/m.21013 type:complete len:546 (+) Transcript_12602:196-1833(+)|eukprot:CAMPEP_0119003158 /NCGR_PEP_ID=MMETSP1176-20130426/387_1 /TAXON_ID=265551 /ORGANISM="Synedropsis recta cf, Strain CCMP1620" /LENGTH=545 /DNA_ID=CAMNT_0006954731 /DNA_START=116 /DNA_END=1753 /DNA_ORIENTATION=+